MSSRTQFWRRVAIFSRLGVMAAAGVLMFRFQHDQALFVFNSAALAINVAAFVWLLRTASVYDCTKWLIVLDHLLVFLSLNFPAYYPFMPMFYLAITCAHVLANVQVAGFSRQLNRFIQVIMILSCPIALFQLYPNLFLTVIFLFLILLMLFVSMDLEQRHLIKVNEEKTARELRQIENSLLRHDFGNLLTGVLLSSNNSAAAKRVVENITQRLAEFMETLEGDRMEIGIRKILERAERLCKERPETEIVKQVETAYVLNVRTGVLISALANVISNACEANATNVTITVRDRKIFVLDNGSGFDVGKLRPGFTTKLNGHGFGLSHSIEGCKREKIPIVIHSRIGCGTEVVFNLDRVIISEPV